MRSRSAFWVGGALAMARMLSGCSDDDGTNAPVGADASAATPDGGDDGSAADASDSPRPDASRGFDAAPDSALDAAAADVNLRYHDPSAPSPSCAAGVQVCPLGTLQQTN